MCHFADDVEYEVTGFVEKNRDNVNQEHLAILRASEVCLFVCLLVVLYVCLCVYVFVSRAGTTAKSKQSD